MTYSKKLQKLATGTGTFLPYDHTTTSKMHEDISSVRQISPHHVHRSDVGERQESLRKTGHLSEQTTEGIS